MDVLKTDNSDTQLLCQSWTLATMINYVIFRSSLSWKNSVGHAGMALSALDSIQSWSPFWTGYWYNICHVEHVWIRDVIIWLRYDWDDTLPNSQTVIWQKQAGISCFQSALHWLRQHGSHAFKVPTLKAYTYASGIRYLYLLNSRNFNLLGI